MIYKKFAQSNNLNADKRTIYGYYKGYFINIQTYMQFMRVFVAVHIGNDTEITEKISLAIKSNFKFAVQKINIENYGVELLINPMLEKLLVKSLDAVIAVLADNDVKGEGYCPMCGETLDAPDSVKVKFGEAVLTVHSACVADYDKQAETERQKTEEDDKIQDRNYIKGIIGALLGGIVGFIPWIILYLIGFVSAWAAVLIGIGANFGYKFLGGKNTKVKYPIIIGATVISVALALFFGFCLELYFYARSEGVALALFDTPYAFFDQLSINHEYAAAVLNVIFMSVLFATIGVIGYFVYLIGKEKRMSSRQSQRLD